jgi:hypothetical protein
MRAALFAGVTAAAAAAPATGGVAAASVPAAAPPPSPSQLWASLQAAAAAGAPHFTIPPGVYPFNDTAGFPSNSLLLAGAANMTIDAAGAEFVLRPGQAITLANHTGLTLRGLTIDYDPPPWAQGAVSDVTHVGEYVYYTLTLDPGYPPPDAPFFSGVDVKTIFWNATTRHMYHWQVQTTTFMNSASQSAPGVWRVRTALGGPTAGYTPPNGSLGTLSPVHAPAITSLDGADLTLEDVTLYASSGMGFLEGGGDGGTVLRRWSAVTRPRTDRLLCTTLDGVHSTSVSRGLLLEDSTVSAAADDLFAVHCELGIGWGPVGDGSGDSYVIDTGGVGARTVARAQPGEALAFYALNATMDALGAGVVAAVSVEPNATLQAEAAAAAAAIRAALHITIRNVSAVAQLLRVAWAAAPPPPAAGRFAALVQYSRRCGAGTVVRNTTLHDTTGGMRLKGVGVTVTNVTITRAYGMRMLPEVFWTQSVAANVSVVGNTLAGCGGAPAAPLPIEWVPGNGIVVANNTLLPDPDA